jgi:hypothetical protein
LLPIQSAIDVIASLPNFCIAGSSNERQRVWGGEPVGLGEDGGEAWVRLVVASKINIWPRSSIAFSWFAIWRNPEERFDIHA